MKKEIYNILLLPYVDLEKDFNVGNLMFYSFERLGNKYIKDKWLYEKVKRIIPRFARFNMQQFDYLQYCDGTLIYEDDNAAIKLNPYDIVELISYAELDSAYDTPNTWDIRPIRITKGDKETKFTMANTTFRESFINKMIFYPPGFLEMKRFNPDYLFPKDRLYRFEKSDMLWGLLQCLLKTKSGSKEERKENRRIISAVKFRNQSERKEYEFKENIRIVLIAAGFEALLNLPSEKIVHSFVNSISLLLGSCTDELRHWAKQFYDVRSRIVHGTDISDLRYQSSAKEISKHIDHYRVAKTIFDECLKTKLYLMGLHEQYQYHRPHRLSEVEGILIPNKKKIDNLLKINPVKVCQDPMKAIDYLKGIGSIKNRDGSTCNEDCLRVIKLIRDIIEEVTKSLMNIEEINKGFAVPLQDLLRTVRKKPCDTKLRYELYWAMRRHDEDKDKKNKLWAAEVVQNYISIDRLVNDMHRITDLIIE